MSHDRVFTGNNFLKACYCCVNYSETNLHKLLGWRELIFSMSNRMRYEPTKIKKYLTKSLGSKNIFVSQSHWQYIYNRFNLITRTRLSPGMV